MVFSFTLNKTGVEMKFSDNKTNIAIFKYGELSVFVGTLEKVNPDQEDVLWDCLQSTGIVEQFPSCHIRRNHRSGTDVEVPTTLDLDVVVAIPASVEIEVGGTLKRIFERVTGFTPFVKKINKPMLRLVK